MRQALVAALLLGGSAALAQGSIEGLGRVTVQAGYRWSPDPYFVEKAAEAGHPVTVPSPGGAQGAVSFGYGATEALEVAVDVFGSWEQFTLQGYKPFQSVGYGALIGVRLARLDFPATSLMGYLGLQLGPLVATVSSDSVPYTEHVFMTGAASAGLTWRFSDRFGLTLDVRYLMGRVYVPGIAGVNVGGGLFSLGFTTFVKTSPNRDLAVPGF